MPRPSEQQRQNLGVASAKRLIEGVRRDRVAHNHVREELPRWERLVEDPKMRPRVVDALKLAKLAADLQTQYRKQPSGELAGKFRAVAEQLTRKKAELEAGYPAD